MYCVITLYSIMLSYSHLLPIIKQDGSHEPECIHVLGLRVQTSAIGKRIFFSRIVRSYRLSEGTWATVHKETTNQHSNITTSKKNHHQHNNIASAMKSNEITSATKSPERTKSPAQRNHQHNERTSEQHQHNNITSATKAPAQRNHQRTAPGQQNHQNKRNH